MCPMFRPTCIATEILAGSHHSLPEGINGKINHKYQLKLAIANWTRVNICCMSNEISVSSGIAKKMGPWGPPHRIRYFEEIKLPHRNPQGGCYESWAVTKGEFTDIARKQLYLLLHLLEWANRGDICLVICTTITKQWTHDDQKDQLNVTVGGHVLNNNKQR